MRITPKSEIVRYLRTGEHDEFYSAWPENSFIDRAERARGEFRQALVAEVMRRTKNAVVPKKSMGFDLTSFARTKLTPMVMGLFPRSEQKTVLDVLAHSVIFLTPSNIDTILRDERWHGSAWTLSNLYLMSFGAKPLSKDAPLILGISSETTCYVSVEYFRTSERFADYVVHEAAHIFHNCKRRTIGLREIRRREWLLQIDYARRETFAYTCEAYSRILEHGASPSHRRHLLKELERGVMPKKGVVNRKEYIDILREAVAVRNGWKRILERCSPPRRLSRREFVKSLARDITWPVTGTLHQNSAIEKRR